MKLETLILDGKKLSASIKEELAAEINLSRNQGGKIPHLAAVVVGNDGASDAYIKSKVTACEKAGSNRWRNQVELLDGLGRSIQINKTSENKIQLDISDLSAGIYFVSIQYAGEIVLKKFVKAL